MKKLLALLAAMTVCVSMFGCKKEESKASAPASAPQTQEQELPVVLYTADVHGMIERPQYSSEKSPMGCAALKAYADCLTADGETVLLIDGGDSGVDQSLMTQLGYYALVPGELELALGVSSLQDSALPYICCNLLAEQTGAPVFEPYKIADLGDRQVAFVGITSPLTPLADSGYCFPQDETAFYELVQNAIDDALGEGADMVIAVGYLGADPGDAPYTSVNVIANTTGITAFLDSRGHVITEGQSLKDKNDKDVMLLSVGSELTCIGQLELDLNKSTAAITLIIGLTEDDEQILSTIEALSVKEETAEATND